MNEAIDRKTVSCGIYSLRLVLPAETHLAAPTVVISAAGGTGRVTIFLLVVRYSLRLATESLERLHRTDMVFAGHRGRVITKVQASIMQVASPAISGGIRTWPPHQPQFVGRRRALPPPQQSSPTVNQWPVSPALAGSNGK